MTFSSFWKLLSIKRTCHLWLNVTVNPARGLPSLQFTSSCEGWNYEMFSVTSCVERRRCRCSFSCFKKEMKWKLSLLHLQDLLKVIKNVFYSFSISIRSWVISICLKCKWDNLWRKDMYRSFKVTRKSCTCLRLINNTWSCDVQRVYTHLICKVLSDLIH